MLSKLRPVFAAGASRFATVPLSTTYKRGFSAAAVHGSAWEDFHAALSSRVCEDDSARADFASPLKRPSIAALFPASVSTATIMQASGGAASPLLAKFLSVFPPLCFGFLQLSGWVAFPLFASLPFRHHSACTCVCHRVDWSADGASLRNAVRLQVEDGTADPSQQGGGGAQPTALRLPRCELRGVGAVRCSSWRHDRPVA